MLEFTKQVRNENGRSNIMEFPRSGKVIADRLDNVLCPRKLFSQNMTVMRFSTTVASDCTRSIRGRGVCGSGIGASNILRRSVCE